jgi:hypothetical protein
MAPPWTDVEHALFKEFLTRVEGPPYENWAQMAKHMSSAIQSRQLACREFKKHNLQYHYQCVFKKHLPVQEKQDFEERMMKEPLSNLNEKWLWADLVEMMNQKIVAKGLGVTTYYEEGYINYKYKAFYGREAAKRKERFPTRLQSTKDEQRDEGEGEVLEPAKLEDLEPAEDEDLDEDEYLDPIEDEYLEAAEDEYPDPTLRRDIEDTEPEFLDPVEPGPSTSTSQPAFGAARSTYWT